MSSPDVILVNEQDEALGRMEKMEAHRQGVLHRALSVFLFDPEGRMLLQQRAPGKYHGGGLWTNACCSHPAPGEDVGAAAQRRLGEELGISAPLQKIFEFHYRAPVENNLVEHEYDHIFAGEFSGALQADPEEVADTRYETMERLRADLKQEPERFTSWFRLLFPQIEGWWAGRYGTQKSDQ